MRSFHLSAELNPPHQQDVKSVLAVNDDAIASCSRDGSIAIWERSAKAHTDANVAPADGVAFRLKSLLGGHQAYVNSLVYIPTTEKGPLLASGGNSAVILLHAMSSSNTEPKYCLIGHALNVCTLAYDASSRLLMSGSWDYTARIWNEGEEEWSTTVVLEGHQAAVWGIAFVPRSSQGGRYLTGSADQLVSLWSETGERMMSFKGYPEPVRSLATLPGGVTFVSACNDGILRVSDLAGSIIAELRGHEDSVFQVRAGKGGHLVSCGEDHSARIWNDEGEETACLLHPCHTVWSADVLPNGDVVTGGSDGKVRLWTENRDAFASQAEIERYNQLVAVSMKSFLDARQRLNQPLGQPRDLAISVDVSDDAEPLQLLFRTDGDPRAASEAFVQQHALPASYVDRIEDFIIAHLNA